MTQHQMPVLTEQQRDAISNWLSVRIKSLNEKAENQEGGLTTGQFFQRTSYEITLAALTAIPEIVAMPHDYAKGQWVRSDPSHPGHVNFYRAPPVPVIKPIENDGWIDWAGGDDKPDVSPKIEIKKRDGATDSGYLNHFDWYHIGDGSDIIAYRFLENDGVGK